MMVRVRVKENIRMGVMVRIKMRVKKLIWVSMRVRVRENIRMMVMVRIKMRVKTLIWVR